MTNSGDSTPTAVSEKGKFEGHDHQLESVETGKAPEGLLVRPARVFTEQEEKALYRKVDLRIMPILAVLYLLSFMDRGNIGNARLNNLERDLSMTGLDFNIALSAFFATYCLFEVPANIILKKLRPSTWLASITLTWGLMMTCMGLVNTFAQLVVLRLLLGIAEAGLFPGVILYLSIWYPRHLYQFRVALFFSAATLAGAFSGILAYAIGEMDGIGGYSGWRWIFILEGLLTMAAGLVAFWAIANFPEEVKFLTEDERAWVIWRKQSDNSSVGEAEHVSWAYISSALGNWQVWLSTLYYMSIVCPLYSISLFLPTIINSFGTYTRPQVQLLTVPVYVFACSWVIVSAIWSDRIKKRFYFVFFAQLLCLVGFLINISPAPNGVKFLGLFLAAAGSYGGLPSVVSWLGNNLAGQTKRGVGMAFQIGIGNLAGIVSSNVYRTVDAPRYLMGHGVLLGFIAMGLVTSPLYFFLLKRENAKKEAELALPEGQRMVYTVQELRDLGDRAPEFKYTL